MDGGSVRRRTGYPTTTAAMHGDADARVKEAPYGEGKKVFWSSSRGRVREKEGKRGSSVPDDTSDDEEVEVADGASSYKVCNMT